MFPFVEIFSVIFLNVGEVEVFQKIVGILLFTLFISTLSFPLNASHSYVSDSSLLPNLLWDILSLSPQNHGVPILGSLQVPFKY